MKSYKDFLYDKNDILVVLAILIVAAGLIFWRVSAIADYPKTLSQQSGTTETTQDSAVTDTKDKKDDTKNAADKTDDAGKASDKTAGSLWEDGVLSKDITVAVTPGSAQAAVQSLIDADIFTSYEQYEQICKAAGYTPENIKATTFVFKAGSTQTDIAKQLTQ